MEKYQNSVTNSGGQSVARARVTVTTLAGAAATIYSDNGVTPTANPLTTNAQGEFSFYAANGRYTLTTTGAGIRPDTTSDIILYDRADDPSPTSAALAAEGGAALVGWIQSGMGAVARWVRDKLRDTVHIKDYLPQGYVVDGSIDYTAYAQLAVDDAYARGVGKVDCSGGRWLIDSADLNVKQGVTLIGPYHNLGEASGIDYTTIKSAFIVNPLYTIRLAEKFSGIKGLGVFKKGLTVPTSLAEAEVLVASFAGKAITVGDGIGAVGNLACDTYAGHCLILGFEYGYYNDRNERPRVEYLAGDCTNGIYMNRVFDMDHMSHCHFWPFLTTHQPWTLTGDAGWRRQGIAYFFGEGVDWGQGSECFSYGHDVGFEVNGSDNVVLVNCGADGYKNNNNHSRGFYLRGTSQNVNLIGCKAAAKNYAIEIDLTGGTAPAQCAKIVGGNLWAGSTGTGRLIKVTRGNAIITGGVSFFDAPVGVASDATAGKITVTNCIFGTVPAPFSLARYSTATIDGNTYNSDALDTVAGRRVLYDHTHSAEYVSKFSDDGNPSSVVFRKARGTASAPLVVGSNESLVDIEAAAYDGVTFGTAARISATTRGASSPGATPGAWIFSTSPLASSTPVSRLIISETGNLYPLTDNAYSCGVTGNRWSAIWAANGTIQTSDARTKKDIADSALGLDFINALHPVSYKWVEGGKRVIRQEVNEDGSPGEIISESIPGSRTHWGLIAQEVKAACDDLGIDFGGWVLSDKDDPDSQQALRYDQFVAPLIRAVQELSVRVSYLENK